jgi:hypothetical protein
MSLLEGSLAALKTGQQTFANQYDKNRQREALKISREQQDIANTKENERLQLNGARETLGNIAQHTGHVTEEQDWAKLYEERPELIVNLSNQRPEFNVFTKADGTEERAELVGYDKRGDFYIPMVKRADTGEIVPMTAQRTELSGDNVVQLTQAQFNDHLKSRWAGGISKGALRDNDGILYSGAKTVNEYATRAAAAQLRESSLDIVGNDPNKSPAQKSAFYQVVNDTDDMDALKQVFTSLGGDVDALLAESDKAARLEWEASAQGQEEKKRLAAKEAEEQRTPLQRALNPRNRTAMGRLAEERMSMLGITDPEEYDMLSTVKDAVEEAGIASAGGKSGFLFKDQTNEDYERNTAAEKFYDRQSNQLAIAKAIVRRPELKREFETLGPLAFFEKYGKDIDQLAKPQRPQGLPSQGGYTPEGTTVSGRPSSAAAPQIATRPPFELTVDNIREAIKNQTAKPTQEQVTAISSFLDSKGIETDADLITATKNGSVAPEDARFVAYVMGMTHSGTTSDKMNETQKLLNAMTYGDREVGQKERSTMDYNAGQSARATAQLQLDYEKHQFNVGKYDNEAAVKIIEDTQDWANELFAAVGYMKKNDGGEYVAVKGAEFDGTVEQATEIGRLINRLVPKLNQSGAFGTYRDANGDPVPSPQAQAFMDRLNPALNFYAQAMANSDEAGIFDGQFYADFFRPNADGTTDFDLKRIRIARKGPNDAIQRIAYVDEDGVNSQEIDISDIQRDNPIVANLLAKTARANGMVK